MRCPYCQQNIRVQGRFCPKCGEQIFGLPLRPAGAPVQPAPDGQGAPARPVAPPPSYQHAPVTPPPPDLTDDSSIDIEPVAAPPPLPDTPARPASPAAVPPGSAHPAAAEEVGKTCPYCRFPLKPDEQVITCPACRLPHHADCWTENRGCTTYGCRGGAVGIAPTPTGFGQPAQVPSTLSPIGGQMPSVDYLQANELSARANNALIFAIIGFFASFCVCGLPLSVISVFMSLSVMGDIKRVRARAPQAQGKAVAALIIGLLGAAVAIGAGIFYLAKRDYQ